MQNKIQKYISTRVGQFSPYWGGVFGDVGFMRYFFNTGWMFTSQILNMTLSFFVTAAVARYLGPQNYGLINYAIGFAGLFAFLAGFGVDSVLNRELVKTPGRKDILIGNGLWIKFFGALITMIVVNTAAVVIHADHVSRQLIFLFSFSYLFQIFGVVNLYFQSQALSKNNFKALLVVSVFSVLAKLVGIYMHAGVTWFVAIYVIDAFIGAIAIVIIYYKQQERILLRFDWTLTKSLLRDGWPFMFTIVATTIYLDIDQIILKSMINTAAVGTYSVAVKLSEVWYFIPNIACASLFPAIINAKKTSEAQYITRLKSLYRLMIGLAVVIAIAVTVVSDWVIRFLFGHAYADAVYPLRIYIWSGVPIFFMAAIVQYLIVENYSKIYFVATVLGAAVNIGLNILFIPHYGIVGSAWATLISYCMPVFVILFNKKTRPQIMLLFCKIH